MAKCLVLLYFILASSVAFGRCTQIIKVGVGTFTPPFIYVENEVITGIDVEIVRLLLSQLDICPEFIEFPSTARAKKYLEVGKVNMLMGVAYTDKQNRSGIYSASYRDNVLRLFTYNPRLLQQHTLIALLERQSIILHEIGQYAGPELEYLKVQPQYQKYFKAVASITQRLTMLHKRFADMSIENELAGQHFIKKKGFIDIVMHSYLVQKDPVFFVFSRKTPILTYQQRQLFDHLLQDKRPEITRLIEKYH